MIFSFCYYALYLCWYSVKYKGEIKLIKSLVRTHLLTPRIRYNMKSAYRLMALQTINLIDNYI